MKNIYSIITGLLLTVTVFAQAPEKMSYQSVIRNNINTLVTNQAVGMRISILQGSAVGTAVYIETQTPISNINGLVSLEIGGGTVVSGTFASIDWSNGLYFIKTETDPTGGTSYTITGTSQLLSTPYALYAKTSGSSTPGPQGPQGEIGPAGAQGPIGLTGAANASGTLNYISKFTPDGITLGNSLLFDNGNNVGIGTNTPSVKLDVYANSITGFTAKFDSPDKTYLGLYEADVYRGYFGSYYGDAPDVDLGSSSGSVHLVTGSTIDLTAKAGDVGIGTTNPSARLEVTTADDGQVVKLNAADQTFMGIWENNAYRGYVGSYYGNIADVDLGSFAGAVHLVNGTGSNNITLTAKSGKVGIGTQDPYQKLDIYNSTGSANIRLRSSDWDAGIDLTRDGSTSWRISNDYSSNYLTIYNADNTEINPRTPLYQFHTTFFRPSNDNLNSLGTSSNRWSVVYAANGTINTSDSRDKTNIQNIKYGLDEIMKLRPVSFNWKENPQSGTKLGLIAQELKEVIDEVVVQGGVDIIKDENGNARQVSDRYGVFYSDLIPVLIKATQEQQLMIDEMKKQIEELKRQIYVNNNDNKTNKNTVREVLASSN